MTISRRNLSAALVVGVAASLISPHGIAATPAASAKARNVVLVQAYPPMAHAGPR